jgi:hypothetical protein
MRISLIAACLAAACLAAACLAAAGCASTPPVSQQELSKYQKDLEDQLGVTRARERRDLCSKLPPPAIGMTAGQVLSSCWGQPDHVHESITAQGKQAVWGYPGAAVVLSNETVTEIVTSR